MNTIDFVTLAISIASLLVPFVEIVRTLIRGKDEFKTSRIEMKNLRKSIRIINQNSDISINDMFSTSATDDDRKMLLYWYCYSIADNLYDLYPKFSFSVSIKKLENDMVSTILTTGDKLFIDEKNMSVNDNSEYRTIIEEGFDYFFVTDLHAFDAKKQKYITSEKNWMYKYNTSIVFPIKSTIESKEKVVGFICVNSPQTLRKKKKNSLIVKLIEKTSDNIANIISSY